MREFLEQVKDCQFSWSLLVSGPRASPACYNLLRIHSILSWPVPNFKEREHSGCKLLRDSVGGIVTSYGRSEIRTPVWTNDFLLSKTILISSGAHQAFYTMITKGLSLDWIDRSVDLTIHAQLAPRIRMSGAIPLLPLYDFMVWTGKTSSGCNAQFIRPFKGYGL
jgi:hypothetical protein